MSEESTPPAETPVAPDGMTVAPGSGLPAATAAGLASLFSVVGGAVFFFLDRKVPLVRYYSILAILLGAILFLVQTMFNFAIAVFSHIWVIGRIIVWGLNFMSAVFVVIWLIVWVLATVAAFRGRQLPIPYLSPLVKRLSLRLP